MDNSSNVAERNPKFAEVYLPEGAALIAVLNRADPVLLGKAKKFFGLTA